VVNGVVYVGGGDNVYAIQASTGKILWIYATGLNVESAPAVVNNVVYVSSDDYSVYALNATTGAKLWSYATGGFIQPDVTVANGVLYAGSNDDKIYAINTV
jgi:outer membrane protein assembly factor BamB